MGIGHREASCRCSQRREAGSENGFCFVGLIQRGLELRGTQEQKRSPRLKTWWGGGSAEVRESKSVTATVLREGSWHHVTEDTDRPLWDVGGGSRRGLHGGLQVGRHCWPVAYRQLTPGLAPGQHRPSSGPLLKAAPSRQCSLQGASRGSAASCLTLCHLSAEAPDSLPFILKGRGHSTSQRHLCWFL